MPYFENKGVNVDYREEDVRKLLKKHDRNNDNRLSKDELINVFKELHALFPGWRARRGLNYADCNGDGYVDEEEMNKLVQYILNIGYTIK